MDDVRSYTHVLRSLGVDTHRGREEVYFAKKGDSARSVHVQVHQCRENQGHRLMVAVDHKERQSVVADVVDHGENHEGNFDPPECKLLKTPVWQ